MQQGAEPLLERLLFDGEELRGQVVHEAASARNEWPTAAIVQWHIELGLREPDQVEQQREDLYAQRLVARSGLQADQCAHVASGQHARRGAMRAHTFHALALVQSGGLVRCAAAARLEAPEEEYHVRSLRAALRHLLELHEQLTQEHEELLLAE